MATTNPPQSNQLSILIVEDSDADADLISMSLARESAGDFTTHRVADLDSAEEQLASFTPDVILLDLNLGTSNGWDTFSRMKEIVDGTVAIVINTGHDDDQMALDAVREGAQDFFSKDRIKSPGLLARVLRYAAQRHSDRQHLSQLNNTLQLREKTLEETLEKLEATQISLIRAAKTESIGHLAAGVAHEVKNPLQIIKLGIGLLVKRIPAEDTDAHLVGKDCADAIVRATRIIGGLLDFGKVKSLDLHSIRIDEIIDRACALVDHDLNKSKILVHQDLNCPLEITVDAGKIEQVLVNTLSNACHAMESSGGGNITIRAIQEPAHTFPARIQAKHSDETVLYLEMSDDGPGIPEKVLPKLFEAFTTTKEPGKGTGLGLPVSRMIIELHGGSMELDNVPEGHGARVRIWLPLGTSDAPLDPTNNLPQEQIT